MAYQDTVRINHTPVSASASGVVSVNTSQAKDLTGVMKCDVSTNTDTGSDSFTITFFDPTDSLFERINSKDIIKIYSSRDGGTTEILEMDATVKQVEKKRNPDNRRTVVTGLNRLQLLLGFLAPVGADANTKKTPDAWIRQILREVNTANGSANYSGGVEPSSVTINDVSKYIKGGLLAEWQSIGNAELASSFQTGTSFFEGQQTAFKMIEELSQAEYVNVRHQYYMTTDNEFVWKPITFTTSGEFPRNHINSNYKKTQLNDTNYIIMKVGQNLYGSASILDFQYDIVKATANGIKADILYFNAINDGVRSELQQRMRNSSIYSDDTFPFTDVANYPFTTPASWNDSRSVTGDADLNSAFIDEVLYRARQKGRTFLELNAKQGITLNRETTPNESIQNNFFLGDNYEDTYAQSQIDVPLRIKKRSKSFDAKKGWNLALQTEQDVEQLN